MRDCILKCCLNFSEQQTNVTIAKLVILREKHVLDVLDLKYLQNWLIWNGTRQATVLGDDRMDLLITGSTYMENCYYLIGSNPS